MIPPVMSRVIAILGGTGSEGSGLAFRFAKAGARVIIGSRSAEKACEAAERIAEIAGAADVAGMENADAAREADIAILTVPLAAQTSVLKSIRTNLRQGAILVDATVPLEVAIGGRVSRTITLWDGSAAQQAARLAPAGVQVVAAFHLLSADALSNAHRPMDCDVLVCGDSAEARAAVRELAELIPGVRAIDAGPLESARLVETAAALLISLNLLHKVKSAGIRVTGLGPVAEAK
jgi:NADPH-dependent F420 reductase